MSPHPPTHPLTKSLQSCSAEYQLYQKHSQRGNWYIEMRIWAFQIKKKQGCFEICNLITDTSYYAYHYNYGTK